MACILIIEDDSQVRETLRLILQQNGHEVLEAANGREGICILQDQDCDLAIVDLFMPEKDGLETIIELSGSFPTLKTIAISGGGRMLLSDLLPLAKIFGALRTLDKPIRPEQLLAAVDELMIGSQG